MGCTTESVNAAITLSSYRADLSPIHYSYDYLEDVTRNPIPAKVCEGRKCDESDSDGVSPSSSSSNGCKLPNSIPIFPLRAGLPWHTGLQCIRQNKYWRAGLQMSTELLELFASDGVAKTVRKSNGASLASLAAKELQILEDDRFTKFAAYLFPEADEERTRLLAATIVFIIIFDDSWEEASSESLHLVEEDFVTRLQSYGKRNPSHMTELQSLITSVVEGMRREDTIAGDAGQEVIDRLVDFCRHKPPQKEFPTLRQYLDYRRIDAGTPYLLACVKFSQCSSVVIEDPTLAPFLRLLSDQISIVNDLASFDKEKHAYDTGKTPYLINVVDVVQKLCSFSEASSAKAICYAMQLEVEKGMSEEIRSLEAEEILSQDQWNFIDGVLEMAAGNVFYSVVASRYGGENTRIKA